MGGYGSGRTSKVGRKPRHKARVEQCPSLNSFKCMPSTIAKDNLENLVPIGPYVAFVTKENLRVFSILDELTLDELIFESPMQTVDSGIGERYYFTCPGCRCRTSRLYMKKTVACRKCHNLSYHSQNIANEDRWLLKRKRLLDRYGLSFEQANYEERKKGMHRKTFERVMKEFHYLNDVGIEIFVNRFEYKRALNQLRKGRSTGNYLCIYEVALEFLGMI